MAPSERVSCSYDNHPSVSREAVIVDNGFPSLSLSFLGDVQGLAHCRGSRTCCPFFGGARSILGLPPPVSVQPRSPPSQIQSCSERNAASSAQEEGGLGASTPLPPAQLLSCREDSHRDAPHPAPERTVWLQNHETAWSVPHQPLTGKWP